MTTPAEVKAVFLQWLGRLGFTLVRDDTEVIVAANPPTLLNPDPQSWMEVQNYDSHNWGAPIWVMEALNNTGQSRYAMAWYYAFLPLQNKTTPQEFNYITQAATGLFSNNYQVVLLDPAGAILAGSGSSLTTHIPILDTTPVLVGGQAVIDGTQTISAANHLWFSFSQCGSCPSGQGAPSC